MNTGGRTGPGLPSPKDKPRIRMMAVSIPRVRSHNKNNLMFKERKPKTRVGLQRKAWEGMAACSLIWSMFSWTQRNEPMDLSMSPAHFCKKPIIRWKERSWDWRLVICTHLFFLAYILEQKVMVYTGSFKGLVSNSLWKPFWDLWVDRCNSLALNWLIKMFPVWKLPFFDYLIS